jgi:hypothetical protein
MSISYSPLHSAIQVLLQPSNGVSIASIKQLMLSGSRLYMQVISNISTLMAAKTDRISSESSRQVTALSSGFFTML